MRGDGVKLIIIFILYFRDIDGAVMRPLPRAKRMLSEPSTLPHLVQLLLTFDPLLIDKVVTLLNNIMQVSHMTLYLDHVIVI